MPQIKQYTAKQDVTLDCGHAVKAGQTFQVVKVFSCEKDGEWPLNILMACLSAAAQKRSNRPTAQADNGQAQKPTPATPTVAAS